MKSTKVVEITLCDLCGREQDYVAKCAACNQEICDCCGEQFIIKIERHKAYPTGGFGLGYIERAPENESRNVYCAECWPRIEAALMGTSLIIPRPVQEVSA